MWWVRTRLATDDGQPGCSGPPPQWQIDNMRTGPLKKKKVDEKKDEGPVITLADYEDFDTATESEIRAAERRHNHRNTEATRLNKKPSEPGSSARPQTLDVTDSEANSKRVGADDDDVVIISDDEESGILDRPTNRAEASNVGNRKRGSEQAGHLSESRARFRSQRALIIPERDEPAATKATTGGVITLEDFEDADGIPLMEGLRHNRRNTEASRMTTDPIAPGTSVPSEVRDPPDAENNGDAFKTARSNQSNADCNTKRVEPDDDDVIIISDDEESRNRERPTNRAEASDVGTEKEGSGSGLSNGNRLLYRSQRAIVTPERDVPEATDETMGGLISLADYKPRKARPNQPNTKVTAEPSKPGPTVPPPDVHDVPVKSGNPDKPTNQIVASSGVTAKGGSGAGLSNGDRMLYRSQHSITPERDKPEADDPTMGGLINIEDYKVVRLRESERPDQRNTKVTAESGKPGTSAPPQVNAVPNSVNDVDVEIISSSPKSHQSNARVGQVAKKNNEVGSSGPGACDDDVIITVEDDAGEPRFEVPSTNGNGTTTFSNCKEMQSKPKTRSNRNSSGVTNVEEDVPRVATRLQAKEVGQTRKAVMKATEDNTPVTSGPLNIQDVPGYEDKADEIIREKSRNIQSTRHNNVIEDPETSVPSPQASNVEAEAVDDLQVEQQIQRSPQTKQVLKATKTQKELTEPEPVEVIDVSDNENDPVEDIRMAEPLRSALKSAHRDENAPKVEKVLMFSKFNEVYEVPYKKKDNNGNPYLDLHVWDKRIIRYTREPELLKPPPTKNPISANLGSVEDIDVSDDELKKSIRNSIQLIMTASGIAQKPSNKPAEESEAGAKVADTEDMPDEEKENEETVEKNNGRRRSARQAVQKPKRQPVKKKTAYKSRGNPRKNNRKPPATPKKIAKKPETIEPPQADEVEDQDMPDEDPTSKEKYSVVLQAFIRSVTYKQRHGGPKKAPLRELIMRRIYIPTGYNDLRTAPPMKEGFQRWRVLATDDALEEMEMMESNGQPRSRRPRKRFRKKQVATQNTQARTSGTQQPQQRTNSSRNTGQQPQRPVGDVITISDNAEEPGASVQPAGGSNPRALRTSRATEQQQKEVITLDDDPPSTGSERSVISTRGSTARTVGGVITIEDFEVEEQPGSTSNPPVPNANQTQPATTNEPYKRVITMADYETGSPPPESERGVWRRPGTSARAVGGVVTIEDYEDAGQPGASEQQPPQLVGGSNPPVDNTTEDQPQPSEKPYQRVITLDDFEMETLSERGPLSTTSPRIATDDGQPGTSGLLPARSRRSKGSAQSGEPEVVRSEKEPEASDKPYERVITLDDYEMETLSERGQQSTTAPRITTNNGQRGTFELSPLFFGYFLAGCYLTKKQKINRLRLRNSANISEPVVTEVDPETDSSEKPSERVITLDDSEKASSKREQQNTRVPRLATDDGQPGTSGLPPSRSRRSKRPMNDDEQEVDVPETHEQSPKQAEGSTPPIPNKTNPNPQSIEKPDVIAVNHSKDVERPATWKPEWPPQLARRSNPPVLNTNQISEQPSQEVIILDDMPPPKTMNRNIEITRRVIKMGNEYIIVIEKTFRKFRERRSDRKRRTVFTLEESERGDIIMGVKVTNMDYYQQELEKHEKRKKAEQEEKENLNWNNYYTDTPGAGTYPYGLRHQPHQFPVEDLEKKKEEQEAKRRKQEEEKRTRGQRKKKRALAEEEEKKGKTPEYFQGVKFGKEFQVDIPAYTPEVDPAEYYKNQEPMGEAMWRPQPKKDKKEKLSFEMIWYTYWKVIWRQFEGHIPFHYALQVLMYSKYSIPDALENIDKSLKKLHQEFKPLSEGQYRKFHNFLRVRIFNRNRLQKEVLRNYHLLEVNDYFSKYKIYHKSFYAKVCRCDDRFHEPLDFTPRWCCSNCTKNMKTNPLPPDQLCLICQTYSKLTNGETRPAKDVVFSRSDMRKIADWNILEIAEHRTVTREEFEKAQRKSDKYRWKRLELTEEEHDMLNLHLVPHLEAWKSNKLTLEQKKELGKFLVEQLTPHPIPLFVPCGCTGEKGDRPWMIRKDEVKQKTETAPNAAVATTVSPVVPAPKKKKPVRGQGKGKLPPEQILTPGAWWTLKIVYKNSIEIDDANGSTPNSHCSFFLP
ncbi:hypothetical protein CAEBREN_18616 [Caenorhabditis brenneri]|uniref:ELM2 domain-containing protein n=1 Tax=Caenorhabditis brenneri TaxID=135651 RepID=G0NQ74_CAEBE|nr:hypothetical protein CAEBREN_18616 [Caenorhabditis brenneri]